MQIKGLKHILSQKNMIHMPANVGGCVFVKTKPNEPKYQIMVSSSLAVNKISQLQEI